MSIFDFTGIELFFDIMEQLGQNQEVSQDKWEQLFNTPGYNILTKNEFAKNFFIDNFTLAYMPFKKDELDQLLDSDESNKKYIMHYLKVKEYKNQIKKHIEYIKSSNLLEQTLELTFHYLPKVDFTHTPTISFLVFDFDARGYSTIVIDILYSLQLKDHFSILLAHELHHYYRNHILSFDFDDISSEDIDIVYIMNQIQAEGIADLIDKTILYYGDNTFSQFINISQKYKKLVEDSPSIIKHMNSLFEKIEYHLEDRKDLAVELRQIPKMSGHPLGYYMANTVIKHDAEEELIKSIDNPFAFFRIYNKVAPREVRFSQDAMKVIHDLEKKYIK